MSLWTVRRIDLKFDYGGTDPIPEGKYKQQLEDAINAAGQAGWEPWHMNGNVVGSVEHVTVWFKRLCL